MVRRSSGATSGILGVVAACLLAALPAQASADALPGGLVIAGPAVPVLDPHAVNSSRGSLASQMLYDGLMRWVGTPPALVPWLATRHEASADGTVHTFNLRTDIRFHDGSPVTAADVAYSMERLLALKGGPYPLFSGVIAPGGTRTQGEGTVIFSLTRPYPAFATLVPELAVVSRARVRENERNNDWGRAWLERNAAGSGGYQLLSIKDGNGFRAARVETHFGGFGQPAIELLETRAIVEPAARFEALVKGEIGGLVGPLPADLIARARDAGLAVIRQPSLRVLKGFINQRRLPGSHIDFRRTLAHAFDYERMLSTVPDQPLLRGGSPLPEQLWGASDPSRGWRFDLVRGRDYLGRMPGAPVVVTIGAIAGEPLAERAALLLQKGLVQLGLQANVVTDTLEAINSASAEGLGRIDVLFMVEDRLTADTERWIAPVYACKGETRVNRGGYCNQAVDALIASARAATDAGERASTLAAAATLIEAEAGGLWIGAIANVAVLEKGVEGARFVPYGEVLDIRALSMPLAPVR